MSQEEKTTKPGMLVTESSLRLAEENVGPIPRQPNGNILLNGVEIEIIPDSMVPPEEDRIVVGSSKLAPNLTYVSRMETCEQCGGPVWIGPTAPQSKRYMCGDCYHNA